MNKAFIKQLQKGGNNIISGLGVFALLIVFSSVLIQIFSRVFNSSVLWTDEIAKICFVWAIYLGAVLVVRDEELIKLDLFANILPKKAIKILHLVFNLMTLIVMGFSLPGSIRLVVSNMTYRFSFTKLPYGILYMASILFFITVLTMMFVKVFNVQQIQKREK